MSQTDDFETFTPTTDVEPLKRAWRNEKAAPEILPFEGSLVGRIKEQIQSMVFQNSASMPVQFPSNFMQRKTVAISHLM